MGGGVPLEVFFLSSRACWCAPAGLSGIGLIDEITWTPRQRVGMGAEEDIFLAQNVILRAHKRHRLPQLQLWAEFTVITVSLVCFCVWSLCLEHRGHEIQLFYRLTGIGVPFMGCFWRVKAAAGRRFGRFDMFITILRVWFKLHFYCVMVRFAACDVSDCGIGPLKMNYQRMKVCFFFYRVGLSENSWKKIGWV